MLSAKIKELIGRGFTKKRSAEEVSHAEGMKFFGHRSAQYKELIQAVAPYVDAKGTIVDVGACIGYFSLCLMEKISFQGKAYLFEPVPNLAKLCHETFKNRPYDVTIFNCGLGAEETECTILVDLDGNIGWNTFEKDKRQGNMKEVKVHVKTFDSLGLSFEPSILKIDVEGNEYEVLNGMFGSFSKWKELPVILCEIGWGKTHPNWNRELATFEKLRKMGYESYNLSRELVEIAELNRTTDVMLIPK